MVPPRLLTALQRTPCRLGVVLSPETTGVDYPDPALGLEALRPGPFHLVPGLAPDLDILLMTAHGSAAIAGFLEDLRGSGFAGAVALWLWDNHLALENNRAACAQADIAFPSHAYCAGDLEGAGALIGPHVPACAAEWSPALATALFDAAEAAERAGQAGRSDRLLAGYVDYAFSPRGAFLARLGKALGAEGALVRLMDPDDRSAYLGQSREDRFREWLGHKVSLALPVAADLSTRVFAGLLAGQVVVVDDGVRDLETVFPRESWEDAGLVPLERWSPSAVRDAHARALALFDRGGLAGARARHERVLEHHMLGNRLQAMIDALAALGREPVASPMAI